MPTLTCWWWYVREWWVVWCDDSIEVLCDLCRAVWLDIVKWWYIIDKYLRARGIPFWCYDSAGTWRLWKWLYSQYMTLRYCWWQAFVSPYHDDVMMTILSLTAYFWWSIILIHCQWLLFCAFVDTFVLVHYSVRAFILFSCSLWCILIYICWYMSRKCFDAVYACWPFVDLTDGRPSVILVYIPTILIIMILISSLMTANSDGIRDGILDDCWCDHVWYSDTLYIHWCAITFYLNSLWRACMSADVPSMSVIFSSAMKHWKITWKLMKVIWQSIVAIQ
jgi:hypothetical protein